MNKIAHYLNFMGKAQAYGLTKEAADDLYKEAGVQSALVQAAREAGRRLAAQGNPLRARSLQRDVGLMLGQRAFAQKYNTDALAAQVKRLFAGHAARSKAVKAVSGNDPLRVTGSLSAYPSTMSDVFRLLGRGNPYTSATSFRGLYPATLGRRSVFNDLRAALGRPLRDDLGY